MSLRFRSVFLLFFPAFSFAQSAPYSAYGIGNIYSSENTITRSMGDVSAAYNSRSSLNFSNPASYGSLELTAFEGSLIFSGTKLINASGDGSSANGRLNYLALGFPIINKKWGAAFGFLPLSRVSYDATQSIADPGFDTIVNRFRGKGDTYKAFFGNGFKIKNFSIGFNAGYVFGKTEKVEIVTYPAIQNAYNNRYINTDLYRGFTYTAGAQYIYNLKNELSLNIGAAGNLSHSIRGQDTAIWERFRSNSSFSEIVDSSFTESDVIMPFNFSTGVILKKSDKWLTGFNFNYAQWSDYKGILGDKVLANSWRIAVGGEYIPNSAAITEYKKIMHYRAGLFYGKPNLIINNNTMNEYGITLGLGLPLKKSSSRINLSLEIGERGSVSKNLIKEQYIQGTIAFTLNDKWFIRRKFD